MILLVIFFASIAGPLNQAKVPPLMPMIMEAFQLSIGEAGWLMSVFSLVAIAPIGIVSKLWELSFVVGGKRYPILLTFLRA